MRFFGGAVRPDDIKKMSVLERAALISCIECIRAREHLDLINCFAAAQSNEDAAKNFKINLAAQAFEGDDVTKAIIIEALSRAEE